MYNLKANSYFCVVSLFSVFMSEIWGGENYISTYYIFLSGLFWLREWNICENDFRKVILPSAETSTRLISWVELNDWGEFGMLQVKTPLTMYV